MRISKRLLVFLSLAALAASVFAIAGCIPLGGGPGSPEVALSPEDRSELGESIGTAAGHLLRGDYVAAGLTAVFGSVIAVGRYFFRRGAVAEITKQEEIESKIKKRDAPPADLAV